MLLTRSNSRCDVKGHAPLELQTLILHNKKRPSDVLFPRLLAKPLQNPAKPLFLLHQETRAVPNYPICVRTRDNEG